MRLNKKFAVILTMILTLAATLTLTTAVVSAEQAIRIRVDGEFINTGDQPPVIVDGRTLVPLRVVMERLGFTVNWNDTHRSAFMFMSDISITVQIDNHIMSIPGRGPGVRLDVPPQIINGRTMVPVRAISEATGFDVDWDGVSRIVDIHTGGNNSDNNASPAPNNNGGNNATSTMPNINEIGFDFRALEAAGMPYEDIQTKFEQEVIRLVNIIRVDYGLPTLTYHADLARVARLRSEEMIEHGTFGHVSPTTGLEPTAHARAMGLNSRVVGENVGSAGTPDIVVNGWMNSTGHRNFILSGHLDSGAWSNHNLDYIGVGFAFGSDFGVRWTLWQMNEL